MEEKYSGDIILISRMIEYFPQKSFEWNANEPITLDDVQFAINHHLSEWLSHLAIHSNIRRRNEPLNGISDESYIL